MDNSEKSYDFVGRKTVRESTKDQFTGHCVPVQLMVPADLRESLKLRAYVEGISMSELAIQYLTGPDVMQKAWVSTRKTG